MSEGKREIEILARIICEADGFDPDGDSFPFHADPEKNVAYPAWQDYEAHARAVLKYLDQVRCLIL